MLCCSFAIADVINYNLELIHNISFENSSNNFGVSDVWGYTDEAGNEYAIVGYQFGTSIYNVSVNPAQEVGNFIGPSTGDYYFHRDYKTYDNFLYVVNEMYGGDVGMQVIDLSPLPENPPIQLETYNYIGQSHNLWIDPSGYAFIEHYNGDNIQITNLTNPSSPVYESTFGNLALNCHDIYTEDNIAYVSEGWSNQFGIYDISNLQNIELITSIPCEGYAHNAWLSNEGTHLITTEETQNKTIKIWDISDLENISLASEYLGENGLAHNVHVHENHLYISHYTTGVKIVDIYNPDDPIEIAAYDTYPQNDGDGFYGCWGAYPFTSNNYVYASDMQNGLFILDFETVNAGWVYGYLYINDIISENSSIKSLLNNKIYYTDDNGYFNFGFPEGTHTFVINEADTTQITILPHQEQLFDIYINNELIIGDINQDAVIDILDIIMVINIILNNFEPNTQEIWCADINYDGNINIQDVILIVNMIL